MKAARNGRSCASWGKTVTFDTSDGDLVRMDESGVVADIATGTLALQDSLDDDDEEE